MELKSVVLVSKIVAMAMAINMAMVPIIIAVKRHKLSIKVAV
jgi:hypothetical protein